MTLLEELNAAKASIATLTSQVAAFPNLSAELATAKSEVTKLTADVATEKSATASAVEKGKTDLTAAEATHKAALVAKDAEVDIKAAAKAVQIVAAAGGTAPIKTKDGETPAAGSGANTKTRAEFDAMSFDDRNAFFRKGGKLTD